MTSRRSSGSMRAESAVEPTRSENITVTWRRSAVVRLRLPINAGCGETGAAPASSAIASSSFLRWPNDTTPMSLRSSLVSRLSSSMSMSLARNISAYWERPIPRSQPSISKFSPLGSCQRQSLKTVVSLAPAMISRDYSEPTFGFAMWTPTTRQQHSRPVTRYQTDLTDAEWRVIAPHLPKPCPRGRPREWPMREIINGIFYVMRAGCPWRLLPNDLPPWETDRWFAAWRDDGRFERINHALVMADRERVGARRKPLGGDYRQPERQDRRGRRATRLRCGQEGQRAQAPRARRHRWARPRARTASGEIQDRDGGGPLLRSSRRIFPFIQRVFADGGYAGEKVATATLIAVEIVRKNPDQVGFAVNPRRWVVERFFAWIGRNRRLAKDFEATID